MVGKAKKSTHGKKASSKALAKRRSSKAPAQKKRVEIDETVSTQIRDPRTAWQSGPRLGNFRCSCSGSVPDF